MYFRTLKGVLITKTHEKLSHGFVKRSGCACPTTRVEDLQLMCFHWRWSVLQLAATEMNYPAPCRYPCTGRDFQRGTCKLRDSTSDKAWIILSWQYGKQALKALLRALGALQGT